LVLQFFADPYVGKRHETMVIASNPASAAVAASGNIDPAKT
jgi:hypothetical protein